jgi:O-antigen/teichoic acid export membrane protein
MTIKAAVLGSVPVSLAPLLRRIQDSPLGYRLAKGAFWSLAGTVVSRGLALVSWILIARMLGKSVYGELGMIQSTVGMFGTLAGLGLGLTATRYVAEYRGKDPAKAGRIIAFSGLTASATGLLASILLLALAPVLAVKVLAAPHLTGLLRIGTLIVLFGTLNGAQTGALSGFEAFRSIAKINLFSGILAFPMMLAGAHFGGLEGAVWGMSGSMLLNWLLNHLALRREAAQAGIPITYAGCWTERDVLWSFSIPVVLTGILSAPVNWYCCALLANQAGGYGEVGLYNAAIQWQTALAFLPALLSQVLLPILSDSHSNEGAQQSRKTLSTALAVFLAVIIFPAVALVALAPWITALYGGSFQLPVRLFITIVGYATLSNFGTALWTCLLSRNRAWFGFFGNLVWAICVLIAFHFLLPMGAFGLALANIASYIAAMAVIFPPILRSLLARKDD